MHVDCVYTVTGIFVPVFVSPCFIVQFTENCILLYVGDVFHLKELVTYTNIVCTVVDYIAVSVTTTMVIGS